MSQNSGAKPRRASDERQVRRLLERVGRRDREAFAALYEIFYPRLVRYLSRYVGASARVEDVLHEVMLVIWRRADSFRGDSRVSTWVFGIAYRKALESLRRQASRPFPVPEEDPLPDPEHSGAPGERLELRIAVREAIQTLPEPQRRVLELTYYDGLSYREIGARLDCPENTVKTRMFHARRKLRKLLAQIVE